MSTLLVNGKDHVGKAGVAADDLEHLELFLIRKITIIFDCVYGH